MEKSIQTLTVNNTQTYGFFSPNSVSFDDNNYLLPLNKPKIMNVYLDSNERNIIGLKISYYNRIDTSVVTSVNFIARKNDGYKEESFVFKPYEEITHIEIYLSNTTNKLKAFEIFTSQNRRRLFGSKDNEITVKISEKTDDRKSVVVGLFGNYTLNEGVTSLGYYFLRRKRLVMMLYGNILRLRHKLRKEKNLIGNRDNCYNIEKLNYKLIVLYKTCLLPNSQFSQILKFIIV